MQLDLDLCSAPEATFFAFNHCNLRPPEFSTKYAAVLAIFDVDCSRKEQKGLIFLQRSRAPEILRRQSAQLSSLPFNIYLRHFTYKLKFILWTTGNNKQSGLRHLKNSVPHLGIPAIQYLQ